MNNSCYTAVIADDLTGAGDTSLQFFMNGASVQVSLDIDAADAETCASDVFTVSSNTRNCSSEQAWDKISEICSYIKKYNFDHVYKKIDSMLRGNIAAEITAVMNELDYDAAVIFPAFPEEDRTTIGGFQLIGGIPIHRTEAAKDPVFPVSESNILNILDNQLPKDSRITALIPLDTVMKGAAAVLNKLNELIKDGKKLIVSDAVSDADLEQISLAVLKSGYKILPAGSAGAAQALSRIWFPAEQRSCAALHTEPAEKSAAGLICCRPELIISGSASDLTASQIERLKNSAEYGKYHFIPLKSENIFSNDEEISKEILENLNKNNTVIVHTSELFKNQEEIEKILCKHNISKEALNKKILEYLEAAAAAVIPRTNAVLITAGGDTSCSCLKAAGIKNMKIIDKAAKSIPLYKAANGRYFVTKSGNLGGKDIFIDILKYLNGGSIG